ncbi:MAG: GTP-binding protein [Candidatus Lokiarchaeota archaeon]|nr:GTP-binding protein [Candidatus Lokiarchaeota archaeon]
MPTTEDRIADLEALLKSTIPNKHTMKSILTLRANIAKLRRELVKEISSRGGGGTGFSVKKSGDAQVGFIGFPSTGKSTLLNRLTGGHTDSKVAAYDFTTVDCVPGMMNYEKMRIQLLDLPGIILGASRGKGRGREILAVLRSVDGIMMIIDFDFEGRLTLDRLTIIKQELYNIGVRLNRKPPNIGIKYTHKGGIGMSTGVKLTHLTPDYVRTILSEYNITNAQLTFYEDSTPDDLIDSILGNCQYVPAFLIVNKIDIARPDEVAKLPELLKGEDWIPVSGVTGYNIDALREKLIKKLDLIRIFLKPRDKEPDMNKPLILKSGATIHDACNKIHKDFARNFRFAKVWGKSAKHPGQVVHLTHQLCDGDVLTIFMRA